MTFWKTNFENPKSSRRSSNIFYYQTKLTHLFGLIVIVHAVILVVIVKMKSHIWAWLVLLPLFIFIFIDLYPPYILSLPHSNLIALLWSVHSLVFYQLISDYQNNDNLSVETSEHSTQYQLSAGVKMMKKNNLNKYDNDEDNGGGLWQQKLF